MKYLSARNATASDEMLLLKWANDAKVRENSFNTEEIKYSDHSLWFKRRLNNPEFALIFIIEDNSGLPRGQARFELESCAETGKIWKLDYSVASEYRGQGLANCVLCAALLELIRKVPEAVVLAEVKKINVPSVRALANVGFNLIQETINGVLQYSLNGADSLLILKKQCGERL